MGSLVRARAVAFDGEPASLACDSILYIGKCPCFTRQPCHSRTEGQYACYITSTHSYCVRHGKRSEDPMKVVV